MTEKEKWIVDEDDELRLFYGDENFNGSAYPCNDIVFMKMIADKLNKLEEENKQLKKKNNELKLLVQNWEALDAEKDEQLDRQNQALKKLKKENLDLSEELDYHKTKCASLETGLFQADKENGRLKKEIKAKDNIVELYYEMVKK